MKVILKEDIYKHGVAGEVVEVSNGFARNWLIPRGMAVPATKSNIDTFESLRAKADQNRAVYSERVNEAARRIDGVELVFGMKAGSNNKLYGSITSQMLKDALLSKTGLDINRRRISERPIRELGRFDIPVRMGDVSPVLKVVVLREEEVAAYYEAQQAAQASAEAEAAPSEAPEVAADQTPAAEQS
jgi:large subunit ribosomal protein L9